MKRGRVLDAIEVVLWIALLTLGSAVALEFLRLEPVRPSTVPVPEGLIEAETLSVAGKSRDFSFWLQPTSSFMGGRWSLDGHMFAFQTQRDDWIDLELPAVEPGAYHLTLFLTRAADYGIIRVSLNGTTVGQAIDLWSDEGVLTSGPVDLGLVELRSGRDLLRLAVVGTHADSSAPHYQFGIDGIKLDAP